MKLLSVQLVVLTLLGVVLGAHSTEEMLKLVGNQSNKVLRLTENNYESFLNGPRDYHIIMLLSSSAPQFNCPLCAEFKPDFEIVANSWYQDHPQGINSEDEGKEVFFMFSEFLEAKDLFRKLKLNNIPKVFHITPSPASANDAWTNEVEEYQFFQGVHRELLCDWLNDITGHKYNLYVPINYGRIAMNAIITFGIAIAIKIFFSQFVTLIKSKLLWNGLALVAVLLFTSGYMFNQIRGAPYVREHPDGKVEYFMPGQQMQLGIETQIVSFIYGLLSLLFVVLVKKVPETPNEKVKTIAVVIVSIGIYIGFSILLSFFGVKTGGYPYRLWNLF